MALALTCGETSPVKYVLMIFGVHYYVRQSYLILVFSFQM